MRMRSRQSVRRVRTQRSAWAFAFGAITGVRITRMPSVRKTSSKVWLNFASRSWTRNRNGCSSANRMIRLRACWATQRPSGFDVLDPSRRERDEEQDVDPLQKGRLDGEEVAGEHARGLRVQEGSPRCLRSLRGGLDTCLEQHLAHRCRGNRNAETL